MVGLWLIGGSGNVATTVAVGLAAIRRGLAEPLGMVTELPLLAGADLAPLGDIALGGCDLRPPDVLERARRLARADRVLSEPLVEAVAGDLEDYAARIRPGVGAVSGGGAPVAEAVQAVQAELRAFAAAHGLARAVAINLASTEPPWDGRVPDDADGLRRHVASGGQLPASAIYALACLELGWGYVNFTPSLGSSLPALDEVARQRGAVHGGRDGKTGQTLLKTVLAPMFAARNLRVLSWFSQNILGNEDGRTLSDPDARRSKERSKGETLPLLLGYRPDAQVDIRYVPPLGDWKVAWDHVLFEGFLGTRMSLQLTWEGADSALAAPLVLDLARLCDRALRRGERGLLSYLALFFKQPMGANEPAHERQVAMLVRHLTRATEPVS
ncbi:MAG TPA: inositol-3-phosphate synthase [Kofleriaceae bacterium]|nr:inositol-3-phosphate synthase [Kofleriaceae bacterium]